MRAPLLTSSGDGNGHNNWHTEMVIPGRETGISQREEARARLLELLALPHFDPMFDPRTGAPVNTAARMVCVCQWQAGEAESVRDLPFAEVRAATDSFSELCIIGGGGGTCLVYQGMLYGMLVAVKVLIGHAQHDAEVQ